MQDAIDDSVTVPIIYEGRVVPQKVTSKQINEHLKHITVGLADGARKDLEQKYSGFVASAQTKQRLNMVAFDLHEHFTGYVKPKGYKAMLICSSRAAAVEMFYLLKNLGGIKPAVVMTPNIQKEGDDEENIQESEIIADFFRKEVDPLYKNNYKMYVDFVTGTFIDPDGDIDLLIVTNMLLTGFDVPVAGVLYVDKPLKGHTFLQAMGRVNRVYKGKEFGLIVDYTGNFKKQNSALDLYSDEKSGMSGFDREDFGNAISAVSEQKTKLELMHNELWKVFEGISKNETSANVWQEHLREYDIRKGFYEKLSSFAKQVDFLCASYGLFESVGFEKSEEYRRDYLYFKKLKDSVLLRFNDSVDFSKYEDGISQLLNTYVNAEDAKIIIEPLDILNKDKMQEQLARLGSKEAKAEAIQTRLVEVLESRRCDDPIMYMTFMDRINKTIQEYLSDRDSEKYLSSVENMAEDYRVGKGSIVYPEIIMDDGNAKAFYDAVCNGIKKSLGEVSGYNEDGLGRLSVQIKSTIVKYIKRDWRDNVIVHRNIKKQLDDLLFDYMEDNNLNWSFDTIDIIIDEIVMVAKKRY